MVNPSWLLHMLNHPICEIDSLPYGNTLIIIETRWR